MKADINTIARECGVSKATVSRVFTGRASVSTPVKEKILRTAKELNYTPQQVAAREVIAIILNSLDQIGYYDGFRNIMLNYLIGEIVRADFLVNIIEVKDIDKILDSYTKTAVVLLNDIEASKYKEKLNNMRMPLIAVGNILDNCNSICPNHYGEIVLAVDHLVKNGHSKISIVLDNADIRAGKERLRGYLETMKKHGLSPMASYDYHPKKQSLIELMAIMMQDSPTATIICGESISNEAVYALNLLGVKVPEKLSLISFEKQDSSRWFSPPHTTIDQNVLKIVTESMLLIEKIIAVRPKEKICTQLPCSLVVRNSVKNINI